MSDATISAFAKQIMYQQACQAHAWLTGKSLTKLSKHSHLLILQQYHLCISFTLFISTNSRR